MDLATMIFSRRFILNSQNEWFIHLRADSSPQGGRDYFICEFDWCQFRALPSTSRGLDHDDCSHVSKLLESGGMALSTRVLPLSIIGSRAASAVHKGRQLLRALALDSEALQVSVARTMSLMFDFGAESGQPESEYVRIHVIIIGTLGQVWDWAWRWTMNYCADIRSRGSRGSRGVCVGLQTC